jgi:3-hydroxyisobutyrate dehydrogenase-like beta-hydroxyacid dehydrogenase
MAARLIAVGHDIRVWNRTPGRDGDLVAAGARSAATPSEAAADAEVVVTMVSDPAALEEVLFGPSGVAEAIPDDATLIDMSTVGAVAVRSAAERLAPVAVLDAPVFGSVPHAEGGTLTILVGGDEARFARYAGLLGALGTAIHIGPTGAGATMKLAGNAVVTSTLVALGEMLALTDRSGLDPEVVLDALARGPLASFVERWREKITGRVDRVDFRLALARKDVGLAVAEAHAAGVAATVPSAAVARCDEAIAAGLADADNSAVVAHLRS